MTRMIHAYLQAPWRTRRQALVSVLVALLALTLVAALYLAVNARAAILGREVMVLREQIAENQRINQDLQTGLASLLSTARLERRARELGYRPAQPEEIMYVVVDGYLPRQVPPSALAPVGPAAAPVASDSLPEEYTMSLLDWFDRQMTGGVGASR